MPDNQQLQQVPSFDPDAYVASHQSSNGFDPDAYISQANGGFNPDKYLDDGHRDIANQTLAKFHAGEVDLKPEELHGLVETAYKGVSPIQNVASWAKGVGEGIANPSGIWDKVKSAASTGAEALGEFVSDDGEDPKAARQIAGGVAAAPLDLLNVGQSLGMGAANLIDQFGSDHEARRIDRIARSEKIAHDLNASVKGVNEYLGADPSDPLNESTRFLAQAFLPVKGAGELSPAIVKTADAIVENAPKAIRYGAPAAGGAAAMAVGHPTLAKEIVAAGYGLPTTVKTIRTVIRKVKEAAGDTSPESTSLFNDFVDAASKAPSQTPMFTYIKQGVDDRIASLQKVTEDFRSANQGKIKFADDPTVDVKDLKGPDKELREKLDQMKFLRQRSDKLKTISNVNKVLTYGGKLSLATAGNALAGGAIMGGISASQAQPQQVEQAAKEGFQTGSALSLPFAPLQAHGALQDLRMSQGRDALAGRGAKIIDPASLQGLTDAQKMNVLTTAGAAEAVGVKTVVLSPEEYAQMTAPQRPEVIPAVEGAPQEPQQVNQQAPNGHYDPNTKTIYLNRDAIGEGTAGHELQHPLQQLWGQMLRENDPSWVKTYDELLAKTGQQRTTSSQSERDAEVGRVLLQNTPIEAFYGGESGADVVKRVASNLLQKIAPNRYSETIGTTDLGAPYSRGDLAGMRGRMFRLGEEAAKPSRTAPNEPQATYVPQDEQTQPSATTQAPAKPVEQVVNEVEQIAKPKVIPAGGVNPQDAVDFLVKMGQTKENAIAKAHAAVQDLKGEGTPVTLENIVKKAMQRSIPKPIESVVSEVDQVAKASAKPEKGLQNMEAGISSKLTGGGSLTESVPAEIRDAVGDKSDNVSMAEIGINNPTGQTFNIRGDQIGVGDIVNYGTIGGSGKAEVVSIEPYESNVSYKTQHAVTVRNPDGTISELRPAEHYGISLSESKIRSVPEVSQAPAESPQTNEEPSRTPTETVPQEATEPAPERGVAGEVQAPVEQSDHPDYKAIGAEAETAKREELSGTRRKTKEQEIARAGLEAMAQAHAGHVDDPDLVTWRTNKYGKTSISGRKLDPNDPFHAHLLEQANLSPEDVKKLNFIESNIGKTLTADYLHAPEEGEASGVTRKVEQAESGAPERVKGEAASRRLSKSFVPQSFTFNAPSKTFEVNGFSPDKFLNNAQMLIPWAKANGLKAWKDINDPSFATDFQNGVENHRNGYTLAGKPIEGTPLTRVKQTKGYEPHVLSKDKADLLNAMMGDTSARVVERKQAPYREAAKADKQILAQQNSPYWEPQTGEVNRIRAKLGDNANLLESTFETLRPELIDNLRTMPVKDAQTLRPSGFEGDRGAFAEKGLPNSTMVGAGFMPSTHPDSIHDTAIKTPDGKIHTGRWAFNHNDGRTLEDMWGEGHEKVVGAMHGEILQELEGLYDDEELNKSKWGYVTKSGQFLNKKEALEHARKINQLRESEYKAARSNDLGKKPEDIKTLDSMRFDDTRNFMPATPKHLDAIAKKLGLRYDGPSLGGKAHQFTDDKTKSSIDVSADATPEQVKAIFEQSRKLFKESPLQFMPSSKENAVKSAAVMFPDGQVFADAMHPLAYIEGIGHYSSRQLSDWLGKLGDSFVKTGFVDRSGNFLSREEALTRAKEIGQLTQKRLNEADDYFGSLRGGKGLEATTFARARKFKSGGVVKVPKVIKPLSRVRVKQRPRPLSSNAA